MTEERDDLRITVTLQRNPMPAGQLSWLETRIENTGADGVEIVGSVGCGYQLSVHGQLEAGWRHSSETAVSADLADYREWFIESLRDDGRAVRFEDRNFLQYDDYGCTDHGYGFEVPPGGELVQRLWYGGRTYRRVSISPSGPVDISVRLESWTRAETGRMAPIEFSFPAWIVDGFDERLLTPPEAIDAALADPGYSAWLLDWPVGGNADPLVKYAEDLDGYRVGLKTYNPGGRCFVIVDGLSGRVREVRERWYGSRRPDTPCPVRP